MKRKKHLNKADGFTLLELMIAISIFGLLLVYVSQFMNQEIRLYSDAVRQNEVEQKARTAMMHVLDETRLHAYTYYSYGGGLEIGPPVQADSGVYYYDANNQGQITGLIDVNPIVVNDIVQLPHGTEIYYLEAKHELWYKDNQKLTEYLISDEIYKFTLEPVSSSNIHFVQIDIIAGDPNTPESYELLTWVRLY